MDKTAIKKYAVWARRELISRVTQKALKYGISEEDFGDINAETVNGNLLTSSEKAQRKSLIGKIKKDGFEQAMEQAAYTWFNRFCALRFMEVNGYLPTHIRVFTDEQNNFNPQILTEAIHIELDGLDKEKVYALKSNDKKEELYKYLLITQCNALGKVLPGMFTKIEDYTELLFPDNLLREGSVIEQMISMIREEDWKDAVQIIGWLYQYYNAEPKDKVFEELKKNIKISKDKIPAATQLFTPDWIVRYMVENSLGRLWVEGHPNEEIKANWKYYLEEAEQEPEVQEQLAEIRKEYSLLNPEQIKILDPCMGSGHILVYAFDVLIQIYEAYGYTVRDAVERIIKNNIFGLDIDERAAQLSYFAIMMKARQYDRRFFSRKDDEGKVCVPQPRVHVITESNNISKDAIDYFISGKNELETALNSIIEDMHDANEYGSIVTVRPVDFELLYNRIGEIYDDISVFKPEVLNSILPLIQVAENLAQKYDVVVTNPPYMGKKSLNGKLSEFLDKNYPNGKSELYSAFISKCISSTRSNGFTAMITIHTWMFISSFEGIRNEILSNTTISSMMHTGASTFEELNSFNVLATVFSLRKKPIEDYLSKFLRLAQYYNTELKLSNFRKTENYYTLKQIDFTIVPGSPFVYWISEKARNNFSKYKQVRYFAEPKQGLATGDNDRFVRNWHEVSIDKTGFLYASSDDALKSNKKWFPYNKGGNFRKWYGMNEYVVDWSKDGYEIKNSFENGRLKSRPQNTKYYFKSGITWSLFGFENFGVRYKTSGFVFDVSGSSMFPSEENLLYILAFLGSGVAFYYLSILAPTVNFQVGNIGDLPLCIDETKKEMISNIAKNNIELSKSDWDSFETSWDFKKNPLI